MKKIVALIDFSDMTNTIIRQTCELANDLKAEIVLLYLTPPQSKLLLHDQTFTLSKKKYSLAVKKETRLLQQKVKNLRKAGHTVSTAKINGTNITHLHQKLELINPAYVILGAKTRSWIDEKIVGSHWSPLITNCKTPIIIVPEHPQKMNQLSKHELATFCLKKHKL